MADNVAITAGAGTTIATDDVSGVHFQKVKIGAGTADSSAMVGHLEDDAHNSGDAGIMALAVRKDSAAVTGGADNDYSALIVDAQGRQWVRPAPVQVRIQLTPTISSGSAYASGDVIGGSSASQALSNAARISGGSGIIQSITVLDKTQAQRAAMDIMFFDRSVTAAADNAAVATSDADMAYCLGVIPIGPYNTAWPGTPLNSISTLVNVGLPFVLNGTDLHVVIVCRGTPTYGSTSDLIFSFTILQD
jgi:predicted nuclease of predicted toxin-antitoxin system